MYYRNPRILGLKLLYDYILSDSCFCLDVSETDAKQSDDYSGHSDQESGEDVGQERQASPVATKADMLNEEAQAKHKKEAAKGKEVEKEKEKEDTRGNKNNYLGNFLSKTT